MLLQGGVDEYLLEFCKASAVAGKVAGRQRPRHRIRLHGVEQVLLLDLRTPCHLAGFLDRIFELAHIPWPVVAEETGQRLWCVTGDRPTGGGRTGLAQSP